METNTWQALAERIDRMSAVISLQILPGMKSISRDSSAIRWLVIFDTIAIVIIIGVLIAVMLLGR